MLKNLLEFLLSLFKQPQITVPPIEIIKPTKKQLSVNGITLLKKLEGFYPKVYRDAAGYPTIGYGHKLLPGEVFGIIGPVDGTTLLINDVKQFEEAVTESVSVALNQEQFDALVIFSYNVGVQAFKGSTLLKKLNSGDYIGSAQEFKRWNHAGGKEVDGLTKRRAAEENLFTWGRYG